MADGFSRLISILTLFFFFFFFSQPNSVAAKLLEGKNRRWSDSAEYYHRTGSGGKDKVSDVPAWTTHYGVPHFPAQTASINAWPTSHQRKQPPASVHFYQPSKAETSNRPVTSSNHHLSAPPAARGHSHTSRVSSQRHRRRSDAPRHLLQVSQGPLPSRGSFSPSVFGLRLLFANRNLERTVVGVRVGVHALSSGVQGRGE